MINSDQNSYTKYQKNDKDFQLNQQLQNGNAETHQLGVDNSYKNGSHESAQKIKEGQLLKRNGEQFLNQNSQTQQEQQQCQQIEENFSKALVAEQNKKKKQGEKIDDNIKLEVKVERTNKRDSIQNDKKGVKIFKIGISEKMFARFQDPRYLTNILKLPQMSFLFKEIDLNKAIKDNMKEERIKYKKQDKNTKDSNKNFQLSKPKKGDLQLTITARLQKFEAANRILSQDEVFKSTEDIKQNVQSNIKKIDLQQQNIWNEYEKIIQENWIKVSKDMDTNRIYFQTSELEQNAKKIATMCQKEWKKVHQKKKKTSSDIFLKVKKVSKELQTFLKRRQKELQEIKKKREKIEQEIQKKEQEKRDEQNQKRKIEFLIQQSHIYAQFMASKLGLKQKQISQEQKLVKLTKEEENEAQKNVQKIIQDQAAKNNEYDETLKQVNGLNFADVTIGKTSQLVQPPQSFNGTLKEYQVKGLRWLDNLYSQGINGILADEMGLGKTIQAIALMAHLSEKKNTWGPFLVIAPTITLFNWYSEIRKFCPQLKVLPFWGSLKDRKVIKKYFQQKYLGKKQSNFHVFITSYQLAVAEGKCIQRVKWQYIILDEAQAIKNINSIRWNTLLDFKSKNKLLLTGTPIQNTMAELWALLHFIMPKLFDSHEQFKEWFSKDIEANSQSSHKINQSQLDRLHAILKPFMLRRVKKDVQKEIGKKIEHTVLCELSRRQKNLYNKIKSKISIESFFHLKANKEKVKNLMNLVMQFRKVCNHPELFERKVVKTPCNFNSQYIYSQRFYFYPPQSCKWIFSNYQDNPFNVVWSKTLFDFEQQVNQKSVYSSWLDDQKRYFQIYAQISEIEYQFYTNPTKQNLFQFIIAYHYIEYQNKIKKSMFLCKINQKAVLKIDHQVQRYLQYSDLYIEKAIANPCKRFIAKNQHDIDQKLWNLSNMKNCQFRFPSYRHLINDSTKLKYLEKLLTELKQKKLRALIFCQMTKMMDIIQEFLAYKRYQYFRLDGACSIEDRRDMVNEFQSNENIFVFLLSTRAGGLGVNLTAADVVIFYDNDWNPTMDAQATDRAHRIGRTKDIHVYKLITKNTIEQRIVERAEQKKNVQQTVYSGEVFTAKMFKPHEVVGLVFEEEDLIKKKELRQKNALLHARKTSKLASAALEKKKNKEQQDDQIEQKQSDNNVIVQQQHNQKEQTQVEIEFDNLIEELKQQGDIDVSKYL